jgi:hypothetical protein
MWSLRDHLGDRDRELGGTQVSESEAVFWLSAIPPET